MIELEAIIRTKQDVQIERLSMLHVNAMKIEKRARKLNFSEAVKLSLRAMSRMFKANAFCDFIML